MGDVVVVTAALGLVQMTETDDPPCRAAHDPVVPLADKVGVPEQVVPTYALAVHAWPTQSTVKETWPSTTQCDPLPV